MTSGERAILRDDVLEARRRADRAMGTKAKDAKASDTLALQSIALSLAVLARVALEDREDGSPGA